MYARRTRTRTPSRVLGSPAPSCERRTPNTHSSAHMSAVVGGPTALSNARRTSTPSGVLGNPLGNLAGGPGFDASRALATTRSGEDGKLSGRTSGTTEQGARGAEAVFQGTRAEDSFSAAVGRSRGNESEDAVAAEGPRGRKRLWSRDPQVLPGRRLLADAGHGVAAAGALRGQRGKAHPGQPGAAHERPPG